MQTLINILDHLSSLAGNVFIKVLLQKAYQPCFCLNDSSDCCMRLWVKRLVAKSYVIKVDRPKQTKQKQKHIRFISCHLILFMVVQNLDAIIINTHKAQSNVSKKLLQKYLCMEKHVFEIKFVIFELTDTYSADIEFLH